MNTATMTGPQVAQAIDAMPPDRRECFNNFLSGWLWAELCEGGSVDVLTSVSKALASFDAKMPR